MHNSSLLRMEWIEQNYISKINKDVIKILDIGSYDINGCYKPIFSNSKYEYIGLDISAGDNVDIVVDNPYFWSKIDTESFDVVISGQAFEHIEFIWATMAEIARVLKKDGLSCIIAPHGFPEHRYPVDCYRFFSDGMVALARYVKFDILHASTNCAPLDSNLTQWYSKFDADTMVIAKKPYFGDVQYVDLKTYKCIPIDQNLYRTELIQLI